LKKICDIDLGEEFFRVGMKKNPHGDPAEVLLGGQVIDPGSAAFQSGKTAMRGSKILLQPAISQLLLRFIPDDFVISSTCHKSARTAAGSVVTDKSYIVPRKSSMSLWGGCNQLTLLHFRPIFVSLCQIEMKIRALIILLLEV